MISRWPIVPLGEVLTEYRGYINAPEPRLYRKLSVKLYGKGVTLDAPADGAALRMKRHQIAKSGQLILSEIWGKKGAIGIVPKEGDGALCTSHFFLFDVNSEKVQRGWLRAIFRANYLEPQLNVQAFGTPGYAAVQPQNLLTAKIPLPPLPEQCRMVGRIEKLAAKADEARALRQQAAERADALAHGQLRAEFKFLAERFGLTPLSSLIQEASYGSSQRCDTEQTEGAVPVLRIPNVASETISLDGLKYALLPTDSEERLLVKKGDILVVRTNGSLDLVGRSAVVGALPQPTAFASYLIRLRLDPSRIVPEYAQRTLRHLQLRGALVDLARTTAGQHNVSLGRLRSAEIPVPPLPWQRRVVEYVDTLQARVNALKRLQTETAVELDALLPSILDKAFKGEL